MKETSCEVIRDLLPLYEDGAASEEAQAMVQEHLKDCPACREELRKMRTPLSLPPEQAEETWKRYAAKLRQKRRNKIVIAAAVLAVFVLACLWCTWPRSWVDIAGNHRPSHLSASLTVNVFEPENGSVILQGHVWQLPPEAEGPATDDILAALDSAAYRGRLRNLVSYTLFKKANSSYTLEKENSKGEVNLILSDDSQWSVLITVFKGGMVVLRHRSGTGTLFFDTDPQVYEALAAVIKEYSTPQDE